MFKKISVWVAVFLISSILLGTILFGSLIIHYYEYGPRFPRLQKIAISIASIPINFEKILRFGNKLEPLKQIPRAHGEKVENIVKIKKNNKGDYLKFYNKNINPERKELLVLPRYDREKKKSVVEILDLSNLKVIHRYDHNIDLTYEKFKVGKDNTQKRFQYGHPLILDDGSLIAKNVMFSPLFKIDICGNDLWSTKEMNFHHSIERDHEDNIWVAGTPNGVSSNVKNNLDIFRSGLRFADDSIVKINPKNGNIIYKKSVSSILLENKIFSDSDVYTSRDPVHLNDIQPVLNDGPYWKKGDIFLSLLRNSSIIHFRPNTNELVNYIRGPFFEQHDIDIISDHEISIFNNNNSKAEDSKFSELLIYNFKTNKYKKLLSEQLELKKFKTPTEGLSDTSFNGSIIMEETNSGRILFYDSEGQLEWEFVNVSGDGKIYPIAWSRLISNLDLIKNIKESIKNLKC